MYSGVRYTPYVRTVLYCVTAVPVPVYMLVLSSGVHGPPLLSPVVYVIHRAVVKALLRI